MNYFILCGILDLSLTTQAIWNFFQPTEYLSSPSWLPLLPKRSNLPITHSGMAGIQAIS